MRHYSYNKKSKILETVTFGVLNIEDIINHYEQITNDDSLPKNLMVLIDCRGTKFDIKVDEISLTKDVVKKALLKFKLIKEAILVDKPFQTVIATLFENYNSDVESYSFRIFSTENAARYWLSLIS